VDFENLPESVTVVEEGEKRFFLVGTAHVSLESVEDVRRTVEIVRPDSICVELCPARHQAMTRRDDWKRMDIYKVIKEGKAVFLMVQLVLQAFYRKIGDKLGVQPGAEMMEGVRLASETGATLVLADRDVQVTLKRVWGYLGFWKKFQLLSQLLTSIFVDDDVDKALIEDLKKKDQLAAIMGSFAESFPPDQGAPHRRARHLSGAEDPQGSGHEHRGRGRGRARAGHAEILSDRRSIWPRWKSFLRPPDGVPSGSGDCPVFSSHCWSSVFSVAALTPPWTPSPSGCW